MGNQGDLLAELAALIDRRRHADPETSYVASLLQGDADRLPKKIIEEAGELALALKGEDRARITAEAADLLFHVLVALAKRDLGHDDVLDELRRRQGTSGIAEKAARKP